MWSYRGCHEPHRGHCCGSGHGPSGPAYYWPPYPGWYAPWFFAGPEPERSTQVPMEIAADTALPVVWRSDLDSLRSWIAGGEPVRLAIDFAAIARWKRELSAALGSSAKLNSAA